MANSNQKEFAGPHKSFPLSEQTLKAAWDLAGHAEDPDAVRAHILDYAKKNHLEYKLPVSAQVHLSQKAQSALSHFYSVAFDGEPDSPENDSHKRDMILWAQMNGHTNVLNDHAHRFMHEHDMPHIHGDDGKEEHEHTIAKAFSITDEYVIEKAWADGENTIFEGWMSTPKKDRQNQITPPEAFTDALDSYFARSAPLSAVHDMKHLPIGHLQKAALVRDGVVFKSSSHPTDPAEFTLFPGTGTGVWVRGVVNEPTHAHSIAKGNMGGMSWTGVVKKMTYDHTGTEVLAQIDPLLESTLAPYPVNPEARVMATKALHKKELPSMDQIEQLLKTLTSLPEEMASKADLEALRSELAATKETITELKSTAQKAIDRNGVGRVGDATTPENPIQALAKKSYADLTAEDKQNISDLFHYALEQGMKD